jgi:hypothetical protein
MANIETEVMAKYYSKLLSYNLTHIMDLSRILYHLAEEPSFEKGYLENELNRIEEEIKYTNDDIANMVKYIPEENLDRVRKYLDNIDKHLAQVYVDTKTLREKLNLNEKVNISAVISDIYYQLKRAENEDHFEIRKIQNYMNDNLSEIPNNRR